MSKKTKKKSPAPAAKPTAALPTANRGKPIKCQARELGHRSCPCPACVEARS